MGTANVATRVSGVHGPDTVSRARVLPIPPAAAAPGGEGQPAVVSPQSVPTALCWVCLLSFLLRVAQVGGALAVLGVVHILSRCLAFAHCQCGLGSVVSASWESSRRAQRLLPAFLTCPCSPPLPSCKHHTYCVHRAHCIRPRIPEALVLRGRITSRCRVALEGTG